MKKIWLVILAVMPLFSCVNGESTTEGKSAKHSYNLGNHQIARVKSKFTDRIKPSESMQVGLAITEKDDDIFITNNDQNFDLKLVDDAPNQDDESDIKESYSGVFKVGQPYEIQGVSYVPQEYDDYEETGTASWYGEDFHGKETANGETYDMTSMTAAHPTLPLPSMVLVTNLQNNKTVLVRVNDRGPFAKERVIDVSEKAAEVLGFRDRGTTEVKIELLKNETDELLKKLKIKN